MFCQNCGAQIPDGSVFCANCGFQLQQGQQMYYQQSQPYQQTGYQQTGYQQPAYGQYAQPVQEQGMKWHKFLVYFSLWAGAVFTFISGIQYMTGAQYEGKKDLVYQVIPGMKAPDILYGLFCIAAGILAIVTAVSLLKYKAVGPKLLTLTYVVGTAGSLIYVIAAASVLSKYNADLSSIYTSASTSLVVSIVMIIVNSIYYKKRAHLFVN